MTAILPCQYLILGLVEEEYAANSLVAMGYLDLSSGHWYQLRTGLEAMVSLQAVRFA